jgi:hypothetical protein
MNPNTIILSRATYVGASGATAAATYQFFTKDYKPPEEERHLDSDVVHNQNGKFKYIYDNGPGFKAWSPFSIKCETGFQNILGVDAATQYSRLKSLWQHPGVLGMQTPDGTYTVAWSPNALSQGFRVFPRSVGDTLEYDVVVQFEEAT